MGWAEAAATAGAALAELEAIMLLVAVAARGPNRALYTLLPTLRIASLAMTDVVVLDVRLAVGRPRPALALLRVDLELCVLRGVVVGTAAVAPP